MKKLIQTNNTNQVVKSSLIRKLTMNANKDQKMVNLIVFTIGFNW
jgi:hypothetical protein